MQAPRVPHGLGSQKGGVEQNCATWQAGQISELFQKGPNRKNRAKARIVIRSFVPCIHSGVHMPTTRKIDVSASYEAAERPKTVASQLANQPPKKALGGRNLHR